MIFVSEKLNELFILEQKAQKMEMINEEVALNIYMEIFENYTPKLSRTYESTIRLLEKRGKYDKALEICEKALRGIALNELSGAYSKFDAIKDRLTEKCQAHPAENATPSPKPKKINYKRIITLFAILSILVLIYIFQAPDKELYIDFEGKDSLEGGENFIKDPKDKESPDKEYPITDAMIEVANNSLAIYNDVKDADIIPQEGTIGMAVIVSPGTTDTRAKEIAAMYIQALSGAAAASYSDLLPPKDDFLGSLYDYYEIIVVVGYSTAEKDTLAKGTKTKGAKKIFWRQLES